ncbi:MAG: hypothetical protein ACR2OJ_04310 [Hyphomicrobiales bacterium]
MIKLSSLLFALAVFVAQAMFLPVFADDTAALAQKAQDPLADITALMTDNTIGFNQGSGKDTGYNFQLQPVKSFDTDQGFRLIARGIIPIVGAPAQSDFGFLGELGGPKQSNTIWGISDVMTQFFVAPKVDSAIKWGLGPQVSLRTRTNSALGGPGWGAGVSGVFFGGAGPIAYGAVVGQHWGQDGFSVMTIQPIVFYNFEDIPGFYIGYNNAITADWKAKGSNQWTVPLGLTAGRTLPIGGGSALDLSLGAYAVVARPDGAPSWQLKFGVSLIQ